MGDSVARQDVAWVIGFGGLMLGSVLRKWYEEHLQPNLAGLVGESRVASVEVRFNDVGRSFSLHFEDSESCQRFVRGIRDFPLSFKGRLGEARVIRVRPDRTLPVRLRHRALGRLWVELEKLPSRSNAFTSGGYKLASNQTLGLLYARNEHELVELFAIPRADGRGEERLSFSPHAPGLAAFGIDLAQARSVSDAVLAELA